MKKNDIFFYLCLSFLAGVFIYSVFFYVPPKLETDKPVELTGVIVEEPDLRIDKIKYTFKTGNNRILVSALMYPRYDYGDKLKITCQIQAPSRIEDFEYDKYLARYDIYGLCYQPKIELLAHNQGNFLIAQIYKLKNYLIDKINLILPEPQSSFLAGLLLGAKRSIPENLQNAFSRTGTTHVVAVSGYNISIIVAFLIGFLKNVGISRKKAFYFITVALIIFVIMTGASASVIRAAVMGFLVLLAQQLGRRSRIRNSLILAAVIMVAFNFKILVFDLGFQLSFLATLGLVYLSPVIAALFKTEKIKSKFLSVVVNDYLLTTISAIIITTPLILFRFGKIALIAPVANILILPFIPLAMLLGFIALLGAIIYLKLGWILGWAVWVVLSYIIWILEKLSGLNWAYYEVPKISWLLMAVSYLAICLFIKYYNKKSPAGA